MKIWYSWQNRRKWYDWSGELQKKKWGLMNACEILTNTYQSLQISYDPYISLTTNLPNFLQILSGCYKYLRMSQRNLRIFQNALCMKQLHSVFLPLCFPFVTYSPSEHLQNELLVSKSQVVTLHHAQGRREGCSGRGRARESLTIPLLNTDSASDGAK